MVVVSDVITELPRAEVARGTVRPGTSRISKVVTLVAVVVWLVVAFGLLAVAGGLT